MPTNSSTFGLLLSGFWLLYFYGANLTAGWFGNFCFDSSELPIITVYAMYIPMFIKFIMISDDLNVFDRYIMPILGLCGCLVMVYAAFAAYGVSTVLHYLIVYAVVMIVGNFFYRKNV